MGCGVSVDRRRLIEHAGALARVLRYALQDLDEETFEAFINHAIEQVAELKATQIDDAWRRWA
jgi:hypothetical protein